MESNIIQNQANNLAIKTAIFLLACYLTLGLLSLPGLIPGITSSFPLYAQVAFVVFLTSLSLMGIVGFVKMHRIACYATLIVAVSFIVLSIFSLVNWHNQTVSLTVLSSASVLIGASLIAVTFRTNINSNFKEAVPAESTGVSYAIQTVNAYKEYVVGANTVSAVNNLNLQIKKSEFIAIMGPSGSGKSTLLNLLGALDRPTSGQILIDGIDISNLNQNQLAKLRNEKIGFVFQAYNLISRSSVKRNMELPALVKGYSKEKREEKIAYLLNTVQLSSKAYSKPKTLSGGEQQRIAVCRALINDPEIILADEPTGNLDSKTGQAIMDFLRNLNSEKKTTIVVVTHDPEVAKRTDKIIYFRDGTIIKEELTSAGALK